MDHDIIRPEGGGREVHEFCYVADKVIMPGEETDKDLYLWGMCRGGYWKD